MINKMIALFTAGLLYGITTMAQGTQTIRGTVTDQLLQTPVAGATVMITGTDRKAVADSLGNFRFTNVAAGTYTLLITHINYTNALASNIIVNTGKEVVLTIAMETKVQTEKAVVITAGSKKNKPLNDMSVVSARAFTVEETQKYAAAVNDPLRMVTGFAGVASADDGGNDIVIRGNAPTGLLWRMEGIDIPNPNHFSEAGSSGGGISILSSQLLANSDFVTGAFAAEYGNALSGVFDLKLRKGNNERKEYALQAGLLGLNAAAEGPLSASHRGSWLVNYRYSTLSLLNKMGLELTEGATSFQDLSYNIYIPTKNKGIFTVFGFGGLSSQNQRVETDSSKWEMQDDRYAGKFVANTGVTGITHTIRVDDQTMLKSALAFSYTSHSFNEHYAETSKAIVENYKDNYITKKLLVSSALNHKINASNAFRAGAYVNFIFFKYYKLSKENPNAPLLETINTNGNTQTVQAFFQWQYKPYNNLTFNAGMHYLALLYNNTGSAEPRISVKWDPDHKSSLALGYGMHSQLQALGVYFAKDVHHTNPNKYLDLTKAHHLVLSYSRLVGLRLRARAEIYYQHLFDVPVTVNSNKTFSTLNIQNEFVTDALTNTGKGRNYGIELTLEKFLDHQLYYTLNGSLYQSKYTAADGVERNTRFNGNYLFNGVAGKEFPLAGQRKVLGINVKIIYAGGYRTTPIDLAASQQEGYTIYKEKEAYSLQNRAYFRPDCRVSIKWNRDRLTSTLSLDIQNVINRKNIYDQDYDLLKNATVINYQNGIIPVLNYKIEW
ncbi:TonB-dependent receptor [Longitalea luteola]|uniref:TonB-dependent receptor n=1 Tax=Longitalea luteola TaxID=2812563 RepID=UPI001A962CCB|nr:TonB-dependent receptor [Longitalea luteola]